MLIKLIGWLLSREAVATAIINHAMKTPYSHLPSNEDPSYMERYWVFNPYGRLEDRQSDPKYWWFPWSIRIHHIKRADGERDMHDHPWNARTFILRGAYEEWRPVKGSDGPLLLWPLEKRVMRAGMSAQLLFGEYHRISRVTEGGVWTLFISGKYQGMWGFLENGVKVPWREYLDKHK